MYMYMYTLVKRDQLVGSTLNNSHDILLEKGIMYHSILDSMGTLTNEALEFCNGCCINVYYIEGYPMNLYENFDTL